MTDHPSNTQTVWDRPTRVFHWSLVAMIALAWVTAEAEGALFWLHVFFGEAVIALVAFRLIWGVVGGRHARFADFVRGPGAVGTHLRSLLTRTPERHIGHNPAAGWMILALLTFSFLASASGLFLAEDDFTGPFAAGGGLDDDLHEGLANVLLFLIGAHVLAALVMSLLMGENLIRAMWTGRKAVVADAAAPADRVPLEGPLWRAAVAAVLAGALALWPFL